MQTYKISQAVNSEEFTFPSVIGLTGPKGIGKSTFAEKIGGEVISLSTPIKKMLEVIIPIKYLYQHKEDQIPGFPEGITARHCLQTLGTEWGRAMHPEIWITPVRERISDLMAWARATDHQSFRCIVDDIRFPNEADMIHELGGELWRIKREGFEQLEDSHLSECGLPDEHIDKEIIV
jgi:ATPase subunit of ABC transporter with duplicated ATPase domains